MSSKPLVSILIPAYNAQEFLADTVRSALAQSWSPKEIIIVDDGSRDGSLEMLREFSQRDSRMKVISRANTGLVGALTDGLRQSRADLIARMDSDDA